MSDLIVGTIPLSKIVPQLDYVLIQRETTDKTRGGLVLIDGDETTLAKVLRVGPGRRADTGEFVSTQVLIGDTVHVNQHSGIDVPNAVDDDGTLIRNIALVKEEVIHVIRGDVPFSM